MQARFASPDERCHSSYRDSGAPVRCVIAHEVERDGLLVRHIKGRLPHPGTELLCRFIRRRDNTLCQR